VADHLVDPKQVVQGEGPGARYAHVLALVGQRFLLVLGGNDGYKVRPAAAPLFSSSRPLLGSRWPTPGHSTLR
jgi:hypothetical protein